MNVSISINRSILGLISIGAGLYMPAILLILALATPEALRIFQQMDEFFHVIHLWVITVTITAVVASISTTSSALQKGVTPLELLPTNLATLLTGMVGMMLVYLYLTELISNGANALTGNLTLVVYAASSATLMMEGTRLIQSGKAGPEKPTPGEGETT